MIEKNIILKKNPRIEFQLHDNGFKLIDEQTERNAGFYPYDDLQSIHLNKVWFPKLAKGLRISTWILNGAPFFPDAESCKKASLIFHFRKTKLGIWLTDANMVDHSKRIRELINERRVHKKSTDHLSD